ncbi:Uma2 family endonuclease [Anthocerotibacter panamensis]|uniref:Uma2 family endonuclease n=1 Tax=Anthocerotibacter panamensis TaxID=2857077 RepID=UPI001C404210|nr:Uma2 family endonuclease [Anthocerotibacter panamensis]
MYMRLAQMTVAEYLDGEQDSPVRHEYLDGQVFNMTGSSAEHNLIAGNIYSRLRSHLRGGTCRAFMSDMKARIETMNTFYYPDVLVTCDSEDRERYFKSFPCLIIEVLSPGTETVDCREKLLAYQKLPSLREYVLVAQDAVTIEVYRRDEQGQWWLVRLGEKDTLHLETVGLTMTMSEVYEDVFPL